MNARLIAAVKRRETLQARSAALRDEFAVAAGEVRSSLSLVDRVARAVSALRARPVLVVAVAVAVLIVVPRRLARAAMRGSLLALSVMRLTRSLHSRRPPPADA